MPFNINMKFYFIATLLPAICTYSLDQEGGNDDEIEKNCYSPETNANTMCEWPSGENYSVPPKTKLKCFCSYLGHEHNNRMIMAEEENNKEIELVCLPDGKWNQRSPICLHISTTELPIQSITLENPRQNYRFTIENMTLFQIFASGANSVTLFITNTTMTIEETGLLDTFDYKYMPNPGPFGGYPFSASQWPFNNLTTVQKNFKSLLQNFHLEVFFKPAGTDNWTHIFSKENHKHGKNSVSKSITLNVNCGQSAVITAIELELTWDFGAIEVKVNGVNVPHYIDWIQNSSLPQLSFEYPQTHTNKTHIQLITTPGVKIHRWPLSGAIVFGENDIKLKTTNGYVDGVHYMEKKKEFSFKRSSIKFFYPEALVIQSKIKLTFESAIETSYWPIKKITLLGHDGYPNDWCPQLEDITKVITTVDMCIHYTGEYPISPAKVRRNNSDAAEQCAKINGRLVEPKNQYLQNLVKKNTETFTFFWIGAKKNKHSEEWLWHSGGSADDPYFKEILGNNVSDSDTCVLLEKNEINKKYEWKSSQCNRTCKYICQSKYIGCGYPHKNEFALMNILKHTEKFPLEVQYTCPEGYRLNGNNRRTCDEGRWSNEAPTCEKPPREGRTDMDTSTRSTAETTINSIGITDIDTTNPSTAEATINIIAYAVIGICTTTSLIIIIISIILCYKKRKGNQKLLKNETLEKEDCSNSRNIRSSKENYNSAPGNKAFPNNQTRNKNTTHSEVGEYDNIPLGITGHYALPYIAGHQKSQQEIEMVESDIYDSIEPQSLMIENDIYDTM